MLKIRLQRVGRKHDPSFRVVLTDSKNGPKSGRFIEILGSYDARTNKKEFKADAIKERIAQGAQLSDTLHNLLVAEKIIDGVKKNVLPKKSPIKKEGEEEAQAEAPKEEVATEEAPAAEEAEAPAEETPAPVEEKTEEAPKEEEEKKEEAAE